MMPAVRVDLYKGTALTRNPWSNAVKYRAFYAVALCDVTYYNRSLFKRYLILFYVVRKRPRWNEQWKCNGVLFLNLHCGKIALTLNLNLNAIEFLTLFCLTSLINTSRYLQYLGTSANVCLSVCYVFTTKPLNRPKSNLAQRYSFAYNKLFFI